MFLGWTKRRLVGSSGGGRRWAAWAAAGCRSSKGSNLQRLPELLAPLTHQLGPRRAGKRSGAGRQKSRALRPLPTGLRRGQEAHAMAAEFIAAVRGKEEAQRRSGSSRLALISPWQVYLVLGALLAGALITALPAVVHRREFRRRRPCRCRRPTAGLLC